MGSAPKCGGHDNGKMDIIVTGEGVHTVAASKNKKSLI